MDLKTSLMFLKDSPVYAREKLYEIWLPETPPGLPKTNCEFITENDIPILDARNRMDEIGLDESGFTFLEHKSSYLPTSQDLLGSDRPEQLSQLSGYLNETVSFIKSLLDADDVICFDWRYRQSKPRIKQNRLHENPPANRQQVFNVADIIHSDDSPNGGLVKVNRYLNDKEFKEYNEGLWRVRIVNLWRPMVPQVEDAPLALCDRRSVLASDFPPVDKIHEGYLGENNYLISNKTQKWFWLSKQTSHEPTLFLTWDSDADQSSPSTPPHTSFENPMAQVGARRRESIEVRMLVLNRKQPQH